MKRLLTSASMILCSLLTFAQFTGTLTDSQGVKYTANDDGISCFVSGNSFRDEAWDVAIIIPEIYEGLSVTRIREGAFNGCSGLTSITIPNSVTSIGNFAFGDCYNLTSVIVEEGNTVLDSRDNCNAIIETASNTLIIGCKATTIPNTVTSIGDYAFYGCSGLTSFTIPNSVISIGDGAFERCFELTSVTIPNSVTSIGDDAFNGCSDLTSVIIGNSVTSIGSSAFARCGKLTSVTIGNSVTSIDRYAFNGCSDLTSVIVEEGNTVLDSRDNCNAIIETASNTLIIGCKATTIPNTVTSIGDYAFYGCSPFYSGLSGLTSITIPNSVTSIGKSAFEHCRDLTSITIPNSVMSIGESAFYSCSGLTSITIPNSGTSIGKSAFSGCSGLTSVIIGNDVTSIDNSVTTIGSGAFEGCENLTSITIGDYVRSIIISESAFKECNSLSSLNVEEGNTYLDSRDNCNAIIETESKQLIIGCKTTIIPNSVTSVGDYAFAYCSGLTSIAIPNSVTSIGGSAFYQCSGLTSITISNSVTSIGRAAFCECSGLTSVTIPNSLTSIEELVFASCRSLTSVTIPSSVISIGAKAFGDCRSLTSITIPNSVTSIGYQAFAYCGFSSVIIPNSVTSIENWAFAACNNLASVTIGNSVTTIGQEAFSRCSHLIEVFVGAETPVAIDENCFSNCVNATLYVPTSSKVVYEAADYWKEFKQIVENNSVDDVSQMDNAIYLDYQEAYINGTVPLYVKMKNTMTPNGCSFKLTLPIGMSLAKDEGGDVIYTLANRADKMNVTIQDHNDGTYDLALMPSTLTATITGNSNTIIKFMLEIPDNISTGDYLMHLTKSLIQSETNNMTIDYPQSDMVTILTVNDYRMGDVNGDDGITPSDAIMTLFYYFNVAQTGFNAKAADVTGDGKVTPADAIEMLYKFFGVDRSDNIRRRAQQTSELNLMLDPQ